jgi:hypothetical protein
MAVRMRGSTVISSEKKAISTTCAPCNSNTKQKRAVERVKPRGKLWMNPMTNDECVADMKDAISEAKSIYEESKAPELTPDEEL